jgi:hypothetical protein
MNWSPPSWITEELNKSMQSDVMVNHYSHPRGRPRLLNALKDHFSPKFENLVAEGRTLKTEEVMAAAGANCGMSPVQSIDQGLSRACRYATDIVDMDDICSDGSATRSELTYRHLRRARRARQSRRRSHPL